MTALSGGRRRRRTFSEGLAVTLLVAAFALAAAGLIALVAYRMVEAGTRAWGG